MRNRAFEPWTVERFLEWERAQPERHEYVGGVVRAMTGGTLAHTSVKGNLFALLRRHTRGGPCQTFVSGPKVVTGNAVLYPDVIVTRAENLRDRDDAVPEPFLIVEVLSQSTASWDRGGKWRAYQELPSLRAYLLVSQDERRCELYARDDSADGWRFTVLADEAARLSLPPADAPLALAEVYEGTRIGA